MQISSTVGKGCLPKPEDILTIETILASLKSRSGQPYYRGHLDSRQGPKIIAAIEAFQADERLPVTGKVEPSGATWNKMKQKVSASVALQLGQNSGSATGARRNKAINFLSTVIVPALAVVDVHDRDMAVLLLGTAIAESSLESRRQTRGSALGLFQVEPGTHDDHWNNWLNSWKRSLLKENVLSLLSSPDANKLTELQFNDKYGAVMAWLKYDRTGTKAPSRHDLRSMAVTWKNNYNTAGGRGTMEKFLNQWKAFFGDATLP